MNLSQENFDEKYYLSQWHDVRAAVKEGRFSSGFEHWQQYGTREGRTFKKVGESLIGGTRLPANEQFSRDPESWIDWEFEEYRHRGFSVKCCLDDKVREQVARAVTEVKSGLIVEVGVFGGATLLHLAEWARQNGNTLVGIDPWEKASEVNGYSVGHRGADLYNFNLQLRRNLSLIIERLDYSHIDLMHEFSVDAARQFEDQSIQFLLLDGDHSTKAVMQDLELWWPKIADGGILWGDDYDWPMVRCAVDDFVDVHDLKLEILYNQYYIRRLPPSSPPTTK